MTLISTEITVNTSVTYWEIKPKLRGGKRDGLGGNVVWWSEQMQ